MARLQLADGQMLDVNETPTQIQEAVAALGPVAIPVIPLTERKHNQPVLVFAAHIVSVRER